MTNYINDRINELVIDESIILGFNWINEAKDFELNIDWCGQEDLKQTFEFRNISTKFLFEFVTDLEFKIDYGSSNMGAMEITSFSFIKFDKIWEVMFKFDFVPKGFLKFKCNKLEFIII